MKKIGLILFSTLFCLSFSNYQENVNEQLLGVWVKKKYTNGVFTLIKKKKFRKKDFGYEFKKNGLLFEQWAALMCGSKKADYGTCDAEWKISSDSILTKQYNFTTMIYKTNYKLLEISDSELRLKIIDNQEIKK